MHTHAHADTKPPQPMLGLPQEHLQPMPSQSSEGGCGQPPCSSPSRFHVNVAAPCRTTVAAAAAALPSSSLLTGVTHPRARFPYWGPIGRAVLLCVVLPCRGSLSKLLRRGTSSKKAAAKTLSVRCQHLGSCVLNGPPDGEMARLGLGKVQQLIETGMASAQTVNAILSDHLLSVSMANKKSTSVHVVPCESIRYCSCSR